MSEENSIILCPGQGAQSVGMGQAWAQASDAAAKTFQAADKILGIDLSKICFQGPPDQLNRTDIAQTAIYTTSIACYRAIFEILGTPVAVAGLSLGEFTALHIAGAFSFEDGLKLVRLRGQAMQEAADKSQGSMVAITGAVTEEQINELCDKARGDDVLVPANFNSPMQVVISGSQTACDRAVTIASEMGLKPTALTVAGAFHSSLMQPAADRLAKALDDVQWSALSIPVISNVTARVHDSHDQEKIKSRLVQQLTSPVRWSQSMAWATSNLTGQYHELAPNKILMGLMRRIERSIRVKAHDKPSTN